MNGPTHNVSRQAHKPCPGFRLQSRVGASSRRDQYSEPGAPDHGLRSSPSESPLSASTSPSPGEPAWRRAPPLPDAWGDLSGASPLPQQRQDPASGSGWDGALEVETAEHLMGRLPLHKTIGETRTAPETRLSINHHGNQNHRCETRLSISHHGDQM